MDEATCPACGADTWVVGSVNDGPYREVCEQGCGWEGEPW